MMSDHTAVVLDTGSESPIALVATTENRTALADPLPPVVIVHVVPGQLVTENTEPPPVSVDTR